jgi:hypothetical protein
MLDLALRWGGKVGEADAALEAARARKPQWKPALDAWRNALGRIH